MTEYIYSLLSVDKANNIDDNGMEDAINANKKSKLVEEWSVIGMSCHFPGGVTIRSSFWQLMSKGHTLTGVLFGRWDSDTFLTGHDLNE